jgi:PTH1 family peptidyl-tRNA hydrolase
VGFLVTDLLSGQVGARLARHKRGHALAAEGKLGIPGAMTHLVLVEPLSFMNESGGPVACLMEFYKVPLDQLVVLHDELDLPLGGLRLKRGGGDNGHNGLRSLRRSLGSGEFLRIRLGIGRPPGRQDPADFVLRPFAGSERTEVDLLVGEAVDAIEVLVRQGLEPAQNQFNR